MFNCEKCMAYNDVCPVHQQIQEEMSYDYDWRNEGPDNNQDTDSQWRRCRGCGEMFISYMRSRYCEGCGDNIPQRFIMSLEVIVIREYDEEGDDIPF